MLAGSLDGSHVVALAIDASLTNAITDELGAVMALECFTGNSCWAHGSAFEWCLYHGYDTLEVAGFLSLAVFTERRRFEEGLRGPEELDSRVRALLIALIRGVTAWIEHDQREYTYFPTFAREAHFAEDFYRFGAKHGIHVSTREVSRSCLLASELSPLGTGLIALRVGELNAVVGGLLRLWIMKRITPPRPRHHPRNRMSAKHGTRSRGSW